MKKPNLSYEDYMKMVTPEMVRRVDEISLSLYRLGNPNITLQQMKEQMSKRDGTIEVSFLKKQIIFLMRTVYILKPTQSWKRLVLSLQKETHTDLITQHLVKKGLKVFMMGRKNRYLLTSTKLRNLSKRLKKIKGVIQKSEMTMENLEVQGEYIVPKNLVFKSDRLVYQQINQLMQFKIQQGTILVEMTKLPYSNIAG